MSQPLTSKLVVALAATALTLAAGDLRGQESEALEELGQESGALEELDQESDPLQELFEEARQVHRSADQYDSIPLLTDIIDQLESRPELTPEARDMLARAYFLRAEAHFNFGESPQASESIAAVIRTEPNFTVDTTLVSPKLADLLDETRASMAGTLEMELSPADSVAIVEGAPPLRTGGSIELLEGRHEVRIERPGYDVAVEAVDIVAGEVIRLTNQLQRTSAVLHVLTEEPDVTVVLDGRETGVTAELPDGGAGLTVDGLEPGAHTVELRRPGFRNRLLELDLPTLGDYTTDVFSLEATRATVRLAGLVPGASLSINGTEQPPPESETVSFEVPVGENRIEVDYGRVGRFVRDFTIDDGQAIGLEIELRPEIALLGVLGGDRRAASEIQAGIETFLEGSEAWIVADHSEEGEAVISAGGPGLERFRELGMASPSMVASHDWSALQKACDTRVGAAAYLIAVLSDDLIASSADLWILPAAPHPARPQRIHTDVGGPEVVAKALEPISRRPTFQRPWLGMRLIESNAAPGLVVLDVAEASPAATSGLEPGDVLTSAGGIEIDRLTELEELLGTLEPHSRLPLTVSRPDASVSIDLTLGASPTVLSWTDPNGPYPLYLAWLDIEEAVGRSELEPWLLQLNRASSLMGLGSWTDAIRLLRALEAPPAGGVGQGTVDYWLGMALIRTDPSQYRDIAIDRLSRAEANESARLYHNDGPRVAPLAAASKKILGGDG